jgi:hypothetical protein
LGDQIELSRYENIADDYTADSRTEPASKEGDFIFADSSTRTLTRAELEKLSKDELRIARNEIFARYGRKFTDEKLQNYFASKSWYTPKYEPQDFDSKMQKILNQTEKDNVELIKEYEKK